MVSPTHRPKSVCFPCNSSALSLEGGRWQQRVAELSERTEGNEELRVVGVLGAVVRAGN